MLEYDIKYLEKVLNIKDKNELYQNYYCWIYPFTNENVKDCFKNIDLKNKNILTVTSSGDQALNLLLNTKENIDTFDSNPLSKYYVELKIAGIKTLSYEEFILFFYNNMLFKKNYYFDKKIYFNKIRKELKDDYLKFWDHLFNNYSIKTINKSYLFTTDYLILKKLIYVNDYMKEDNYYKLKETLLNKTINYYDLNINSLNKLDKKYDIIYLSNIIDSFSNDYDKSFKSLNNNLNKISKDNTIILAYLYDTYDIYDKNEIYNKNNLSKYLKDYNYEYEFFNSTSNLGQNKILKFIFPSFDGVIKINKKH